MSHVIQRVVVSVLIRAYTNLREIIANVTKVRLLYIQVSGDESGT